MAEPPEQNWQLETILQHLGEDYSHRGAVVPPLFQNSLFTYKSAEEFVNRMGIEGAFDYTRVSNPTVDLAQQKIAALEQTDECRLFGSGMAAICAAIMSTIQSGDHVICTHSAYGPTRQFLRDYLPKFGVTTTFVDGTDLVELERALKPNTKTIFLESPGTFFFHIQDLEAISSLAKPRGIKTIIDNSNATPVFQQPANFGIDLVCHTVTKYLGGHSDVVAGAVCGSTDAMKELVFFEGVLLGGICDPFAAWLITRSLRTLAVRMERHQQSAILVANMLQDHPKVETVHYPGLSTHPGQDLIRKQMSGTTGLLTFTPKQRDRNKVFKFCEQLELFQIGVSWGGHESLAIPVTSEDDPSTWHVRVSVGLENANDLIADLQKQLSLL